MKNGKCLWVGQGDTGFGRNVSGAMGGKAIRAGKWGLWARKYMAAREGTGLSAVSL